MTEGHGHSHGHSHGHGHGHSHGLFGHHDHGPRDVRREDLWRLRVAIAINVVIVIGEGIGGYVTGSLALLSDAAHNLTDVGALLMAYFATRFATLPPNSRKSYGYYRLEILSALANGLTLVLVSLYILVEAWHRFQDPPSVDAGPVLVIATLGLAANAGSAWILMARRDSMNIRGAFLHLVADSVSSVGVIVASVVILSTGLLVVDVVASAVIAVIVVVSSWSLLRDSTEILLQGVPRDVDLDQLKAAIQQSCPTVLAVPDLHVWSLTSGTHVATLHVVVPQEALADSPAVIRAVTECLHDGYGIGHVTVQVEPPGFEEPGLVHD